MSNLKLNQKIKDFWRLKKLAEEFAKVGIKAQSPRISPEALEQKIIEKRNLNNLEEQCGRKKLLKTLLKN